jgi:hypothetical protein
MVFLLLVAIRPLSNLRDNATRFVHHLLIPFLHLIRISGWFKLLDKKAGSVFNVPVQDIQRQGSVTGLTDQFNRQTSQEPSKPSPAASPVVAATPTTPAAAPSAAGKTKFCAADFKFLKVLGKGSFGKVPRA